MRTFLGLFVIIALTINAVYMDSMFDPQHEVCGLADSVEGFCKALLPAYSYRLATDECVFFYYGGCGGNDNNFESKEECEQKCKMSTPLNERKRSWGPKNDSVTGPCRAGIEKYSYRLDTDECKLFTYGGCYGNDNQFESKEECEKMCKMFIPLDEGT